MGRYIPKALRLSIMSRGLCERCGKKVGKEIHHVIPYALLPVHSTNGQHEQLILLCKRCHFILQAFPHFEPMPDTDKLCTLCHQYASHLYLYKLNQIEYKVWLCPEHYRQWLRVIDIYKSKHF